MGNKTSRINTEHEDHRTDLDNLERDNNRPDHATDDLGKPNVC